MGVNDRDWIKPKRTLLDRWHGLPPLAQNVTVIGGFVLFVVVLIALGRRDGQTQRDMWDAESLQYAISYGDVEQFRWILRESPQLVDTSMEGMGDKDRLIHFVAQSSTPEMMEVLLEFDGNVQAPGTAGRTPLHYAAAAGNVKMVELLIARGADVSSQDVVGFTPLIDAAGGDDTKCFPVVQSLVNHGADINKPTGDGKSPLEIAEAAGNLRIAALLKQLGAGK